MSINWPPKNGFADSGQHSFRDSISRLGWRTAFSAIVLGVVGNAAFAVISLVPQYRDQIGTFLVKTPLFWIIVYATLIGFFGVLLRYNGRRWSRMYVENHQSEMFVLNSLDDSLLRLLPGLVTTNKLGSGGQDLEARMDRLVMSFLDDANTWVLGGKARRELLFCPDERREQLVIRYGPEWVMDDLAQKSFRISNGRCEGVVGEAYEKAETIVAHHRLENGRYRWDKDSYMPSTSRRSSDPPPYNAIICIPVTGTSRSPNKDNLLGVVCFDSVDPDLFDPPEVKETLEKLARHLATSLQIYSKLLQACSASSCVYVRTRPAAS